MSQFIIIFDGIEDHIIERNFFYDSDFIGDLSHDEIREISKYTIAYSNLIKNRNTMYSMQVEWGCMMMADLIRDIDYFKERNLKLQRSLV